MPYQTCAIVSRQTAAQAHDWPARLRAYLLTEHTGLRLVPAHAAELIIVVGGDGTLLETLRDETTARATLLALNTGSVGFLSSARDSERFIETLEMGLQDRLVRMAVPVLEIVHHAGTEVRTHRAVNDLLLERTMTWSTIRVEHVHETETHRLKEIRGSGACVCSAVGSTTPMAAHFQAPLLDPLLPAVYLKGTNDTRSPTTGLVVSMADGWFVRLTLNSIEPNLGLPEDQRLPPVLYADGAYQSLLAPGDRIEIRYANQPGTLLRRPDDLHHDRVRSLL